MKNWSLQIVEYSLTQYTYAGEEEDDAAFEAPKIYEAISTLEQLRSRLELNQGMYNEAIRGASMDLVFFKVLFTKDFICFVKVPNKTGFYCNNLFIGCNGSFSTNISDIEYSTWQRPVGRSGWKWQAITYQTCFIYRRIQDFSNHTDKVGIGFMQKNFLQLKLSHSSLEVCG